MDRPLEWKGPRGRKAPVPGVLILVLHGFGCSPLAARIPRRFGRRGYTVALPLLSGHGRTPEEMEGSRRTEGVADAKTAFLWLEEQLPPLTEEELFAALTTSDKRFRPLRTTFPLCDTEHDRELIFHLLPG